MSNSDKSSASIFPETQPPSKNIDGSVSIPSATDAINIKKDAGANLFEEHIREEKKEGT